MIEIWLDKAQKKLAARRTIPMRWLRTFSPAVWIVAIISLFFVGRIVWLRTDRAAHLQEITAAFGTVNLLQNPAQFNRDFTKFTGVTILETHGVGLFIYDTATGNRRLVDTQTVGPGPWRDDFDLKPWAWAPDDSAFIYSMMGSLVIHPLDTNVAPSKYPLETNEISEVVWLNPAEFVWLEVGALGHARKTENNHWEFSSLPLAGQMKGLQAIDSHTIGWAQDSYLCRYDFSQDPTGTNFAAAVRSSRMETPPANSLVLWLDGSTLNLSNNAPITFLKDLSTNANYAVNNEEAPRFNAPGSAASLNGRGTIHFSSSNAQTIATGLVTSKSSGITGNHPRTVYAVMRREVGRLMVVGFGNGGVGGAYFGVADQFDGYYLPATMATDNKAQVAARNWNILAAVYDGTNESGYVNGELKCTTQFQLKTTEEPLELGIRTVKGGAQWRRASSDGDFAELLVYNRVLNRSERRQVERYLTAKWFGVNHISSKSSLAWHDTGLDAVTGFLYSPDTGQFFLNTTNPSGGFLHAFNPTSDSEITAPPLIHDRILSGVQWIGAGEYIFAGSDGNRSALFTGNASGKDSKALAEFDSIGWFKTAPGGGNVMIWGVLSNEPAEGLWEYDTATKKLRSIAACSLAPSPFARKIKSSSAAMRLPTGRNVTLTVFTPPNFDRKKKYPLVLGDTYVPDPIHGQWLQEGMAAGGAFVIFVSRGNWNADIELWEENVNAVYDVLKEDPCIDTERVFLIGASAETHYMKSVVEKAPRFWKGVILLNPSQLPDFSKSPRFQNRPRILISTGEEERMEEGLKQYQRQALPAGVMVDYVVGASETHRFSGSAAKLARLQAINHFIFEE